MTSKAVVKVGDRDVPVTPLTASEITEHFELSRKCMEIACDAGHGYGIYRCVAEIVVASAARAGTELTLGDVMDLELAQLLDALGTLLEISVQEPPALPR